MKAIIHLNNKREIHLDESITNALVEQVKKDQITSSFSVFHFFHEGEGLKYSVPLVNVSFIEYFDIV